MRKVFKTAVSLALLSLSASSFAQVYGGYPDIPATSIGNATEIIDFQVGPGVTPGAYPPERTLGLPNGLATPLGRSGSLVLSSLPMSVKGDNTAAADMYVYEHGLYESWDVYVSTDTQTWLKVESVSTATNSVGTVRGYDIDSISSDTTYPYIKLIDTSNSAGTTTSGADIDGIVIAHAKYNADGSIVDTDSRNGVIYNLLKDSEKGSVSVKIIDKQDVVSYVPFTTDDSLDPVALSVQGNFDCDDEKDINVLATRKDTGIQVNIIKDQAGNDIRTIDNSIVH
jgi:hypothetical protein